MRIADAFEQLIQGPLPLRFTAYDGSASGPEDAPFGFELRNERGLAYLMTAPGDLGLGRAYVTGDLVVTGVHPGDPYDGPQGAAEGPEAASPVAGRAGQDRLRARDLPPQAPDAAEGGDAAALAPRRRGRAPLAHPRHARRSTTTTTSPTRSTSTSSARR